MKGLSSRGRISIQQIEITLAVTIPMSSFGYSIIRYNTNVPCQILLRIQAKKMSKQYEIHSALHMNWVSIFKEARNQILPLSSISKAPA